MAIEKSAEALVKFENPERHGLDNRASDYFSSKFKKNFLSLEKSIVSSWRTHKAFYEALGEVAYTTTDKGQAKDLVAQMLSTLKSKTCS